jgi:hypothetical protein
VGIGSLVEKLFWGNLSQKIPRLLPQRDIGNFFPYSHFSACRRESIGMLINLIVEIGPTVEK